jgi:hypothetical protein
VALPDKPFPQRTETAPHYRVCRLRKDEEYQIQIERAPAFNLRSKLVRARIAISSTP